MTVDQADELVAAVRAFLAELDEAEAHDECGECPPTVETRERLRAAVAALTPAAS